MRKITILIVGSPSFSRVVEHLFCGMSEFEVVGALSGSGNLEWNTEGSSPELIVANVKPVRSGIGRVVASIKDSNPSSKLILVCPVEDLSPVARQCGADACLRDEKLASHLLRTARTLSERSRPANAGD